MKVHLGTDHAGFEFKEVLKTHLGDEGYEVIDHGALEYDALDDYPAFCIAAAQAVGNVGDGWMSRNAQDMVRIAAFAGFDTDTLVRRVAFATVGNRGRTINAASVERVMEQMEAEQDAAEGIDAEARRREILAALKEETP